MIKYQKYKGINILWAKEIPSHWHICRISNIFGIRREKNKPVRTKEVLSLSAMYGVSLYSDKKEKGGNKPKEDFSSYNLCYPGDILVNCMNIVSGAVGISKYFGAVSPVYYPLVNLDKEKYDTRFMEYIFRNYNFQRGLVGIGKGIQMSEAEDGRLFTVRMRISWENLKVQMLIVPTIEEQEHIANYLDWKIGEIDKLIVLEKQKIDELKVLRQQFIDKIIESLDNDYIPFKAIFSLGKGLSITKDNLGLTGVKCINYGEIHGDFKFSFYSSDNRLKKLEKITGVNISAYANLEYGNFVFADTSEDIDGCGNFTYLEDSIEKVYAGYHTIVGKLKLPLNCRYLAYYFESEKWRKQVRRKVKGVKVFSITQAILKSTKIQIPNHTIQNNIVNILDTYMNENNKLSNCIDKKINNLIKLKQSLISEVVTGQIDVRNVKIPESK